MPEPLIMHSPEKHLLWQDWDGVKTRRWERAKREMEEIVLAMLSNQSQRSRDKAKMSANCMMLRLRYGYTAEEIANELAMCHSTVSSTLVQTRRRIKAFMKLPASEQAARLLRVYFGVEQIADVPECQLQTLDRSIHLRIDTHCFILSKNRRKSGDEVYLRANTTVKTATGNNRAPSVYVGRPNTVDRAAVLSAASKLQSKLSDYGLLSLAGD